MSTTERLCALLRERHEIGLKKYGVTLDRDDYTPEQWIQHAVEEQLDAAGYLMRLKDTITDLRNVAENLYHELNDLTPEKDCQCIPHGELCRSCKFESARIALRAWEAMK